MEAVLAERLDEGMRLSCAACRSETAFENAFRALDDVNRFLVVHGRCA